MNCVAVFLISLPRTMQGAAGPSFDKINDLAPLLPAFTKNADRAHGGFQRITMKET